MQPIQCYVMPPVDFIATSKLQLGRDVSIVFFASVRDASIQFTVATLPTFVPSRTQPNPYLQDDRDAIWVGDEDELDSCLGGCFHQENLQSGIIGTMDVETYSFLKACMPDFTVFFMGPNTPDIDTEDIRVRAKHVADMLRMYPKYNGGQAM